MKKDGNLNYSDIYNSGTCLAIVTLISCLASIFYYYIFSRFPKFLSFFSLITLAVICAAGSIQCFRLYKTQ